MPRLRSSPRLAMVIAATLGAVVLAQGDQRPPVFRGGVELFELEVSVLDRDRRLVRGLTADDFTVFEDGVPQRIVQFSEVELPDRDGPVMTSGEIVAPDVTAREFVDRRLVAIVLDDFGIPFGGTGAASNQIYLPDIKKVARQIVQSLGPKDFGAVVLTRDPRAYPDFTNMTSKLTAAIEQMRPPGEAEAFSLMQVTGGRIGMIGTLREVLAYMDRMPQHRKVIVYIGLPPSIDFARRRLSPSADRIEDLIRLAQASGISIFGFDAGGPIDRGGQGLLLALAENTGGRATGYAQLDLGVRRVFEENKAYYLLGFERTGPRDGKTHKLDVKVKRGGVALRFRRSYTAPGTPDMVKAPPALFDAAADSAVTALGRALDSRRVFLSAVAQPGAVAVIAEISAREQATGRWGTGADVDLSVADAAGVVVGTAQGRIEKGDKAAAFDIPLREASGAVLPAGRGPFRASVKIRANAAVLEDATTASTGGMWLGAARVSRGQGSARAPLRLTAEFQFSRNERLLIQWIALQAIDRREARLLRRTGEPTGLRPALSESEVSGARVVSTAFSLNQLAPGDYVLEVVAGRGTETERRLLPFRVVQ